MNPRSVLLLLAVLLASCGSAPPPTTMAPPSTAPLLPLRPASSPDYYILGISGKCITDAQGLPCFNLLPASVEALNTKNNYNYLESRGTLEAVAQAVRTNGWTAQIRGYAASLEDRVNTSSGTTAQQRGFLSFVQDVTEITRRDIQGVRNPSKIILVHRQPIG